MKTAIALAPALLLGTLVVTPAGAAVHYQQDFESDSAGAAGGFLASTEDFGHLPVGFGSNYYRNDTSSPTTIAFTLAAPVGDVTLGLDLIVLDSWDGNDPTWGLDAIRIRVDDHVLLDETVTNFPGNATQTLSVLQQIVAPVQNLAVNSSYADSAYRFTLAAGNLGAGAHTVYVEPYSRPGSGAGYQAGLDESFAIDNVLITSAVPEPGTWLLTGAGMMLLGLARRRR